MIKTCKDLKFFLAEDAKRNGVRPNWGSVILKSWLGLENACAYRYIRVLRICEYLGNCKHKRLLKPFFLYYKIRLNMLGRKYGIYVRRNSCGYGLRLIHLSGGGCRIGAIKAGNYCGFNAGVLIGANGSQDSRPTLGDHVAFGPGAKAFGKISIGSNVFVAPNAVVTKDVPDNCIVGGVPAKFIKEMEPIK